MFHALQALKTWDLYVYDGSTGHLAYTSNPTPNPSPCSPLPLYMNASDTDASYMDALYMDSFKQIMIIASYTDDDDQHHDDYIVHRQ